jgi:multidrug efflux pump subunit AcrA (membrane-fusion protein)
VFTIVAGKAKSVPIRVGLSTDAIVEVRGTGLEAGQRVITSIPDGLQDGSSVVALAK